MTTSTPIDVGTVLRDTYELTSRLGQGGMGAVYLARHRRLPGRQVAVKVLHQGASLSPEVSIRFRREAEVTSQLGHPHIVEVLDFDTLEDGTAFLVMEYLRGESLEERLRRGALPLEQALAVARRMGSALQAAHRAGVVHRDLKPANVFLVRTEAGGVVGEHVKLLDFGISKIADSQTLQTQEAVLIGTPQYMSPEQAQGRNREVDARTDLFALGCIVYEMLSATSPFGADGGSMVQVLYRIVHEPPAPLASLCPGLPSHVLSAVERALAKELQARHPDVASFIAELTGTPLPTLSGAAGGWAAASSAASTPLSADEEGFADTLAPGARTRSPVPAAGGADEEGFADTLAPGARTRSPVPAATGGGGEPGFADTLVPSATVARAPAAVAPPSDEVGLADTLVPASTLVRAPAPAGEPASVSPSAKVLPGGVASAPPPPRASSRLPVAMGAGVLLLVAVGAGWWFGSARAPTPESGATPAVTQPVAPETVEPPRPPEAASLAGTQAASPGTVTAAAGTEGAEPVPASLQGKAVAPASAAASPSESTRAPPPPRRETSESLPESVRNDLKAAEKALAAGNAAEAIRLAQRSLRMHKSAAALSVITRAYCLKGDFSAKGFWRQLQSYPGKDPSSELAQVRQYCKQHDFPL